MKLTYIKTLTQAKEYAAKNGYETEERDGRLYLYKNGEEIGSTLIDGYTPEPSISAHAINVILKDREQQP